MTKKFRILHGEQALAKSVLGRIIAIYGTPGSGKTGFALSATKNHKTLFIDTENATGKVYGSMPEHLVNKDNFFSVDADSLEEVTELLSSPDINLKDYDLIVFDSMTHLIEAEARKIRNKRGKVSLPDWGDIGQAFKNLLYTLQLRGINVLFTVHEEETASENGLMQHRPKTEGKAAVAGLIQRADSLLFLEKVAGVRRLSSEESARFIAKSRDKLKPVYEGAEVCYDEIKKGFSSFVTVPATAEQMKEFEVLMKEAKLTDKKKFLDFLDWDGKSPLSIDALLRGETILNSRIEILNAQQNDTPSVDDSE